MSSVGPGFSCLFSVLPCIPFVRKCTWPVIGSIERIDASYMDKLIPSNVDIEVRAEKNIFSADGGLWVTKKGYEGDASSGYFLFSEKKENLVLRLDNLAHTVYFRGSGCREPNSTKCLSRKSLVRMV